MTPAALWKDFDVSAAETDISIVRDEVNDGIKARSFYFTALKSGDAVVRCYVSVKCREADLRLSAKLPALISLSRRNEGGRLTDTVLSQGYADVCIDFGGAAPGKSRFTIYPPEFGYADLANYKSGKLNFEDLYRVKKSAKETAWYVWAAMTRRAVTIIRGLDFIDKNKIGLIGSEYGANVVWNVIGTDLRLAAAAAINTTGLENGYLYSVGKTAADAEPDEENALYRSALGVSGYIPYANCPTLAHSGTNTRDNIFDRASVALARFPGKFPMLLSVSPRLGTETGFYEVRNIVNWFACRFSDAPRVPDMPIVTVEIKNGKLGVSLRSDSRFTVDTVKIFYAYDEPAPAQRNWFEARASRAEDDSYYAEPAAYSADGYFFCFGTVRYTSGFSVSSLLNVSIPEGATPVPLKKCRMIYDAKTMGLDCFTAETGKAAHDRPEVTLEESPVGIGGVTAEEGALVSYKLSDPRFFAPTAEAALTVAFFSASEQDVTFAVTEFTDGKEGDTYRKSLRAPALDVWQKTVLTLGDFKTDGKRPLGKWDAVKKISILSEGILLGTLLWV
ncbi:MAG: hypothetical protein LBS99_02090 [Clostridiales bacterium]|nr:hypothetical protein [Clostridiales bacterium]